MSSDSARRILWVAAAVLAMASACQTTSTPRPDRSAAKTDPAVAPTVATKRARQTTAAPPDEWVAKRTRRTQKRLTQTDAGTLVWKSIEAHGGLDRWFKNGPLHFRFAYQPLGDHRPRDTYATVDTWSARARHHLADHPDIEFGWTGEHAWVKPAEADLKIEPRFWSLTPYYFVGMPFVLGDPGVNFEMIGPKTLRGSSYQVVKASFDDGTGDAPDDHYVLYFDPDTHKLHALRYVVSYPGFFPNGGHSPEKIMFYNGHQTAGGITFAKRLPTHKWDADAQKPLQKVTDIEVSDIAFRPDIPKAYFQAPSGAKKLKGY